MKSLFNFEITSPKRNKNYPLKYLVIIRFSICYIF